MAQASQFATDFFAQNANLINVLEDLQVLIDRTVQDTGLVAAYFALPSARTDITATQFNAAIAAVNQLIFAFNSGSPAQKAAMFKLL